MNKCILRYIGTLRFWSSLDEYMYKINVQNSKSNTAILRSSEITSICDRAIKNSVKSDMNTEAPSMWSDEDIPIINRTSISNDPEFKEQKPHISIKARKISLPQFQLAPVSKGFSLTLDKYLTLLEKAVQKILL